MKVIPGSIVDYYSEGEILAAVVISEEKGRLRVVTEKGREDRIAPGRVLAAYEGDPKAAAPADRRSDTARAESAHRLAAAHARAAAERRGSLDIALVWDLLVDEDGEHALEALAEIGAGDRSAPAVAAMLRALLEEKAHFTRRGDLWEPRGRDAVEEILKQRDRERQRADERERFVASARGAIGGAAPFVRSGEEEETRILRSLEELAVQGSAGPASRDALAILAELPVAGETPEESAFRALAALGILSLDENLFIRRFGLKIEFPVGAEDLAMGAIAEALGAEPGGLQVRDRRAPGDAPGSPIPPGLAREIESGSRRDLTDLEIFSVDDELTSEIDDALSIEDGPGGSARVGVHIADPDFFVRPGSELDRIAESRAVTFYLPECRALMLPRPIAEGAAALQPGVARPALSFFATLGEGGEILDLEIVPSVIRSRTRVTYEQADDAVLGEAAEPGATAGGEPQVIRTGTTQPSAGAGGESPYSAAEPQPLPAGVAAGLRRLHDLALQLEASRVASGAHLIRAPEIDIVVEADGTITLKRLEGDSPGRLLVSEMMILTGRLAARFCLDRGVPCIFRRQPPPEESVPAVTGGPYDPVAARRARRGLRRSETGLAPGRHYALGLDAYAQATSPIRRYQDLAIHRQIKSVLRGGAPCYDTEALQRVAATTDEAERAARLAERGTDEYWTLKYLERQLGQEIEGVVVYREPRRVEVELCETLYTVSITPRPDHELGLRVRFVIEAVNPRGPSIRLRQLG
jgi:exoribonuclease-2